MNQLMGGVFASLGVYKTIPLVHGSLGCANYVKHILVEHFKEPVEIATTGFYESDAIHGGIDNLIKAIENVEIVKNPELMVVLTTGLSETIGEDIKAVIKRNYANKNIVAINTPSYVGTHIDGYNNTVRGIIEGILEKKKNDEKSKVHKNKNKNNKNNKNNNADKNNEYKYKNEKINFIHGLVNPGDVREFEHIFNSLDMDYNLLMDIKSMDRPLRLPKEEYPKCHTTVESIKNAIYSKATVSFGMEGISGANYLEKYGVKSYNFKYPIGIENTDKFIEGLLKLNGLNSIPERLLDDRGYALDMMVDTNYELKNKKVAIFGDPDKVLGLISLAYEVGLKVVAVLSNTKTKYFANEVHKIFKNIAVFEDDLYEFQKYLKNYDIDLIIGDYRGKYVADALNVPLVRVGFPVIDRYGHTKKTIVGYNGALNLIENIANTLI